jgi:hypothetical protein
VASGPDQFALVRAAHLDSPIWGVVVKYNVPETLCDGRFNIHPYGNLATLTLTQSRPRATDLFSGAINNEEVVRARIHKYSTILALRMSNCLSFVARFQTEAERPFAVLLGPSQSPYPAHPASA